MLYYLLCVLLSMNEFSCMGVYACAFEVYMRCCVVCDVYNVWCVVSVKCVDRLDIVCACVVCVCVVVCVLSGCVC